MTCFGRIRPSSGTLGVKMQHMVFCTEFVDGWWSWDGVDGAVRLAVARHHPNRTHDLHSGSQDNHPSTNSVQKTICSILTSIAPDDGRMRPKHIITLLHQVGISHYFMMKMHGQTILKLERIVSMKLAVAELSIISCNPRLHSVQGKYNSSHTLLKFVYWRAVLL